ncbi:hypothetical protein AB0L06_22880 [Spirillospora sp. NPDC052269]
MTAADPHPRDAAGTRVRLTGHIDVPLPPGEAFPLFTPLGERAWADGWAPVFPDGAFDGSVSSPDGATGGSVSRPDGASGEDTEPGIVFETSAHGRRTVWIVVARRVPSSITYARTTPDDRAGTVTVELSATEGGSRVQVTYDLTALRPEAVPTLEQFASSYPAYLHSWETAIKALLAD